MIQNLYVRLIACVMLAIVCSAQIAVAVTNVQVTVSGDPCPTGSNQERPWTTIFINGDTGDVTHVEHTDCDGKRTVGVPGQGLNYQYNAYSSFLYRDNNPTVSPASGGGLAISLGTAAKVEVRDGYTGSLLATFPTGGNSQTTSYSVSSSQLSGYSGHLIVVDVIRTSDNSYRGTKSVIYNP